MFEAYVDTLDTTELKQFSRLSSREQEGVVADYVDSKMALEPELED